MIQALIFSMIAIAVGLAFCFVGYRFFRVLLPIWAFFAGLFFGVSMFGTLMGTGFFSTALGLVIGFFLGLLFALLSHLVFSLAIVLFGASIGFALGQGFMLLLGFQEGFVTLTIGLVLAIVFALIFASWRFPRLFVVFVSSLGGAMAIIMGIFVLFGQVPTSLASLGLTAEIVENSAIWTLAWFGMAVFGFAVQYSIEKSVDLYEPYVHSKDKPING